MKEYIVTGQAMVVGGKVKSELVRCKDCTHRNNSLCCPMALLAEMVKQTKVFDYKVSENWYCGDGKRKEE